MSYKNTIKSLLLAVIAVMLVGVASAQNSALKSDLAHFRATDPITITINQSLLVPDPGNADDPGLAGADKIYMHSGIGTLDAPFGTVVGNWGSDDGVGLMTDNGDGTWSIDIVPADYYGTTGEALGIVFRNADGTASGRNPDNGGGDFVLPITDYQGGQVVHIEPTSCQDPTTEITVFFDANVSPSQDNGVGFLVGEPKVYFHSGGGPSGSPFDNTVGNWGTDDGVGEMKNLGGDIWGISLVPADYYGTGAIQELGMVFRSADGTKDGRGPDGGDVVIPLTADCDGGPVETPVTFSPAAYGKGDIVTIRYDAKQAVSNETVLLLEDDVYLVLTLYTQDGDQFTLGDSGDDDDIFKMEPLGDHVFELSFIPSVVFPLAADQLIDRVEFVFREAGPCDPCTTATDVEGLNYSYTSCE